MCCYRYDGQRLVAEGADVYLNVNNHYEGCAPLTIERIEGMLTRT